MYIERKWLDVYFRNIIGGNLENGVVRMKLGEE